MHKDDEKSVQPTIDATGPTDTAVMTTQGVSDVAMGVPTNSEDPTTTPEEVETLQLQHINVAIKKGELCAVVGPVG